MDVNLLLAMKMKRNNKPGTCTGCCVYDDQRDCCTGCGHALEEIHAWLIASLSEKTGS